MTDQYGHLTDQEILDAAGIGGQPGTGAPAAVPNDAFAHIPDSALLQATAEIPKTGGEAETRQGRLGTEFKAPSGQWRAEPTMQDAIMAQIPFASDVAGLADMIAGGKYSEGRNDFWAANERYKQQHPILDRAAQVLGTVTSMGTAPGAGLAEAGGGAALEAAAPAAGGNLLAQSARSAAVAAPIAGAYGFGTSSGDLPGRLRDAEIAAVTGGALGAAAPTIARGIGAATDQVSKMLGVANPSDVASSELSKALTRDKLTPEDLSSNLAIAPEKPLTIADVAGSPKSATSRLARTVLDMPGDASSQAQEFLTNRDLGTPISGPYDMMREGGAADRIVGDLRKAFGNDDAFKTTLDLVDQRNQASTPLFDAFRAEPPTPARQIQPFMTSPTFKQALTRARNQLLDEGQDPMTDLIDFNDAGDPVRIKNGAFSPDILSRIKQGIDDVWLSAKSGANPDPGEIRTANMLRSRFLDFMKAKYPDTYPQALQAYSGPSQSIDAIQRGLDIFKTAPHDLPKLLASAAPEDRDMIRLGVKQALIGKVQNTADGANEVRAMFGKPALRNAISSVFDNPQDLQQLSQSLGLENRMFQTSQLAGGSRTAQSLADQGDLGTEMAKSAVEAVPHAIGGNIHGAAMRMIAPLWNRYGRGLNEQAMSQLGDMLFNPETAQKTIEMLKSLPADQQRQALARALSITPPLRNALAIGAGESQ